MMKNYCLTLLLLTLYSSMALAQRSPLGVGDIYKIQISKSDIYRIDRAYITDILSLSPQFLQTKRIDFLTSYADPLDPSLDANAELLRPVPYFAQGLNDNSFDPSDYILVYLEADGRWRYNEDLSDFEYKKNTYSQSNFLYVRIADLSTTTDTSGRVLPTSETFENINNISNYWDYQHHELDKTNILKEAFNNSGLGSGQRWYGEQFRNSSQQEFAQYFDFNNALLDSTFKIRMNFAGRSASNTSVRLRIDNEELSASIRPVNLINNEALHAREALISEELRLASVPTSISISYPVSNSEERGWLDYISLRIPKKLNLENLRSPQRLWLPDNSSDAIRIDYSSNQGVQLWNITDALRPMLARQEDDKIIVTASRQACHLMAFVPELAPRLPVGQKIKNQSLRSLSRADYIIIAPQPLFNQAERLLQHRIQYNALDHAHLVDVEEIFNEYSSGKCDPTAIRNFLYDIKTKDEGFQYLLLFGDASFDYRHLYQEYPDENIIPTFQTPNSLHPLEAFPTDDYYALLRTGSDDNLRGALDIAVGRLPISNSSQAKDMVDKIIQYETKNSPSPSWLNTVTIVADDGDRNIHLNQAEDIARIMTSEGTSYSVRKLYLDSYREESGTSGNINLNARNAINTSMDRGQIIINYIGHGGTEGWASERVLRKQDVSTWSNQERLPLFITATCTFAGYDDPSFLSAGEQTLLSPNGGGIALFTTVRAVFSRDNARLTRAVFQTMFGDIKSENIPIGEILRRAKNSNRIDTISSNARKFTLLGDPLLRLKFPEKEIKLNPILSANRAIALDTISALDRVTISGYVMDNSGAAADDSFDGIVDIQFYDKPSIRRTLGQDNDSRIQNYEAWDRLIHSSRAEVLNGRFEISFVVPRDINYSYGNGILRLIAQSKEGAIASAYNQDITIGGTSDEIIPDNIGPQISGFIESRDFENGDVVPSNTILLLDLTDESGINTTGQAIGHNIELIFDGGLGEKISLNDYYEGAINDFRSGKVAYPLNNLEPGDYEILIRAWDNYNNPSELMLTFSIQNDAGDNIFQNLRCYPNPFTDETKIAFTHNGDLTNISYRLEIFGLDGRLVYQNTNNNPPSNQVEFTWSGRGSNLNSSLGGVYIYRIITRYEDQNGTMKEVRSPSLRMLKIN